MIDIALLRQEARKNTYTPHGDLREADCVLAFSFGYIEQNGVVQPGQSNCALANYIESHVPQVPLIAQLEIAMCLEASKPALVISEHRELGEYLNSREITEQALILMKAKGWTKALLVTHPAMLARNDAICTKLGIKTILPDGLQDIPYDKESVQPWTRDKASWWRREQEVIDICVARNWI